LTDLGFKVIESLYEFKEIQYAKMVELLGIDITDPSQTAKGERKLCPNKSEEFWYDGTFIFRVEVEREGLEFTLKAHWNPEIYKSKGDVE
jgi:hypothetical protein